VNTETAKKHVEQSQKNHRILILITPFSSEYFTTGYLDSHQHPIPNTIIYLDFFIDSLHIVILVTKPILHFFSNLIIKNLQKKEKKRPPEIDDRSFWVWGQYKCVPKNRTLKNYL